MNTEESPYTHCALGAVSNTTNTAEEIALRPMVEMALLAEVTKTFNVDGVPTWNDAPGRTEGEVFDMMLHAAKSLRNMNNE
jgi:hypothetical protein